MNWSHPTPGSKRSSQLYKMYQSQCTSKNSWWWAERLPKICSCNTNKIGIRHICWFYSQGISYFNFRWQKDFPLISNHF